MRNPRNHAKNEGGSGRIETAPEGVGTTSQGLTTTSTVRGNVMAGPDPISPDPSVYKKRKIPGHVRVEVARRYGATPGTTTPVKCEYCEFVGEIWWPLTFTGKVGVHLITSPMEFDHVDPELHGGAATADNLVLACLPCNRGKGSKDVRVWTAEAVA